MPQPWEIADFLKLEDGRLYLGGASAAELAAEYGTPLFVFSESRIRENIARLFSARDAIDCSFKVCYAAKANSTMAILRTINDAGCDIEVNSGGELWKALKIGFGGEQIIFNGTSKEIWEIESAIDAGIYAIQVDSLYELSLIEAAAKRLGKRANVSLRLVPEIETKTHSGLQTALLTSKFGMMPDEAYGAFAGYKNSPHLDLCGIHLHIGSQNPDPDVYVDALEKLFDSMVRIHLDTGVTVKHINLGGGFPVNYLRTESRYSPLAAAVRDKRPDAAERYRMLSADFTAADAIKAAWRIVYEKAAAADARHLLAKITLMIEPGRSIISDAGVCLTTVRNIKQRPLSDINRELNSQLAERQSPPAEGVSFGVSDIEFGFVRDDVISDVWLLTDAGFNILLSMETYKWYYDLISAVRPDEPHNFPYKVAGPLCDGGDVYFDIEGQGRLPPYRLLPDNVRPGEVLALLNCGAYSLSQASQYNGRFLPPAVLIREDGRVELIRSRDSFEDLIGKDIF